MSRSNQNRGFTLVETLLVVAIIALIAVIIFIAVQPDRDINLAQNSQRSSDALAILNAVYQYSADHGQFPVDFSTEEKKICRGDAEDCRGLVDLSVLISGGNYLTDIPVDPVCPADCLPNSTGYIIYKGADGRITVSAPHAALDETISISR